jgi:hypothetical protein
MGIYRLMTRYWPTPRNPEIRVSGGFIEFYVTATDQLLSRTIFLYLEVIRLEFVDFYKRMLMGLKCLVKSFFNYFRPSFDFKVPNFSFSKKLLIFYD